MEALITEEGPHSSGAASAHGENLEGTGDV
jgi:hypothetical protein